MTCFLMGRNSEFMEALPDDAARIDHLLADLDEAFSGNASLEYSEEASVHNWSAAPYTRGSYSFPAPGTRPISGSTMRQVLAQPVGSQLYFAGEATHNTAPSTVVGALQPGERAGEEVDTGLGGPPAAGTPTADFSALPESSVVPPLVVSFTDLSTELPTGWAWDFGDTGTSSDQHPTHEYTAIGEYTVSLTATNPNGSHTRVMPKLILVPEPSAIAMIGSGVIGLALLHARRRRIGIQPGRPSHARRRRACIQPGRPLHE
jgi:PKD repeat protein